MNKPKAGRVTTRFVVTIGALLLVTNIVLGSVLMVLSTAAFRTLIRQHMLSLSTTAAGLLDGDALGALTEADVGNQAYNDILNRLSVFQSKSDVIYIYAVRQVGADDYVFTVDPDPEKPAAFGSPVVVTEGLRQAARGNTTAYTEMQERLDAQIQAHTAAFGVAVFDINLLKEVNDRHGHAAGDRVIRAAAEVISDVFGPERTYRIGGDEFVAVALHATESAMTALLVQVEENVKHCGRELSLSAGAAVYRPGQDRVFQDVFVRSDRIMYQKKEAFHSRRH